MKNFQTALLFIGIALSSTYALAAIPAAPAQHGQGCADHKSFQWTSTHPNQDPAGLMVWYGVAPDGSKLEVLGRHQPRLTKTIFAAGSCNYEMNIGGDRFTRTSTR